MKISEILKSKKITLSCELFPPKTGEELSRAAEIVKQTAELKPSFISVTYGAGGSNSRNTLNVARETVKNGVEALAHLTCVGLNEEKLLKTLEEFGQNKIENILALRGDIPSGENALQTYAHASDLIKRIKTLSGDKFCVGGACYPEGHPESDNIDADIEGIKIKAESGCEFITTQMFFDNSILYSYMFRLLKNGIDLPVIAGIMPVTNAKQISRIVSLSGTAMPARFNAIVDRFGGDSEAMKQAGIAYATEQIIDLIANGVNNIHIYTMNRPDVAGKIIGNLSRIID